ncbi:Uncharacterised protein [Flavobacterium hibernum]|nr:Uncharacterised protein [Flavobacterium hibernum]
MQSTEVLYSQKLETKKPFLQPYHLEEREITHRISHRFSSIFTELQV